MHTFKDRFQKIVKRASAACALVGSKELILMAHEDGFLCLSVGNKKIGTLIKVRRYHFEDTPGCYIPYSVPLSALKEIAESMSGTTAYCLTFWQDEGFVLKSLEDDTYLVLSDKRTNTVIEPLNPRPIHVFGTDGGALHSESWTQIQPILDALKKAASVAVRDDCFVQIIDTPSAANQGYAWQINVVNVNNNNTESEIVDVVPVRTKLGKGNEIILGKAELKFLLNTLCKGDNNLLKVSKDQKHNVYVLETEYGALAVPAPAQPQPIISPDGWNDDEFRSLSYKGERYGCAYGQETGALTVSKADSCQRVFALFFYLPDAQALADLKEKARQDKSWIAYAVFLNNLSMYPSAEPYLDITKATMDAIQKGYRFGFLNGTLLAMSNGTAITARDLMERQKTYIKTWRLPEEREY